MNDLKKEWQKFRELPITEQLLPLMIAGPGLVILTLHLLGVIK